MLERHDQTLANYVNRIYRLTPMTLLSNGRKSNINLKSFLELLFVLNFASKKVEYEFSILIGLPFCDTQSFR